MLAGSCLFLNEKAGERKALCCRPEDRRCQHGRKRARASASASSAGRSRADLPSRAARSTRPSWWWRRSARRAIRAEASASLMRAMARASRAWCGRSRIALLPRQGLDRERLSALLPPGAARNALDCALWDLEAKVSGRSAAALAGLPPLHAVQTALTISLGSPEEMAARARQAAHHPLLKLKLGGDGDEERLAAIREAVPDARLIADANEAWRPSALEASARCGSRGRRRARRAAAARGRGRDVAAHCSEPFRSAPIISA